MRRCLLIRLDRVHRLAKRVASGAADNVSDESKAIELVHDVRVACRRAMAALRFFEEFLPRKVFRRCRKRLRRLRRAAGELRDLDVFVEWLRTEPATASSRYLMNAVCPLRQSARERLRVVASKLVHSKRWRKTLRRLKQRAGLAGASISRQAFAERASARLRQVAAQFLQAIPNSQSSWPQWHAFRIAVKRLRYTIELVAKVLPEAGMHYNDMVSLQTQLGELQDVFLRRELVTFLSRRAGTRVSSEIQQWVVFFDDQLRQKRTEIGNQLDQIKLVESMKRFAL